MSSDYDNVSVDAYLGVMFVGLTVFVLGLILFYAEKGFPWHTYLTCIIGYWCAFGVLICVPVDIGATVQDRRSTKTGNDPGYDSDATKISTIYTVFYIIILILCGFIMCVEEYYNTDGYFSVLTKLLSSTYRMLRDTIIGIVICLIILAVLIGQKVLPADGTALLLATVLITNTMYEGFLMFLLGYGLVSLPMRLWNSSDAEGQVTRIQNAVASDFKGLSESSFNVSMAVADVFKTKEVLASYGDPQLKDCMDILIGDCPPEFRSSTSGTVAANKEGKITIHTLADLRTRLNLLKDRFRMAKSHLENTKRLAYQLEDIANARKRDDGAKTIFWSLLNKESTEAEYTWHVITKPLLCKLGAVIAAVFSLFSYLGVIGSMHGMAHAVSVYYMAVHDPSATGAGLVIFVLVTFGYATYVAFWALFEIRLAGLMELVPGSTTPESLSFNVRMVARLSSPLAFFYLGWLWESGVKYTTEGGGWVISRGGVPMPSAFSKFYQIQVLPGLGDAFGTAFPSLLFIVSFLTLTNLLNRIFVLLKLEAYQFGPQIVTEEQLSEGKRQLDRNKKATARTVQRENLRDRIADIAVGDTSGVVSFIWGMEPKKRKVDDVATSAVLEEPAPLSGNIERKGGKNSFGLEIGWKEEFAVVKRPGVLHFFKEMQKAHSGLPGDYTVDLRLVLSFNEVSLGAKGESLEIETPDSSVKLRFKSKEEMKAWKNALILWKDYSVDYAEQNRGGVIQNEENEVQSPFAMMQQQKISGGGKGGKAGKDQYDLDAVEIGEFHEQEEDDAPKKAGLFGALFSGGSSFKKKQADELDSINVDAPPASMEGWLEKKTASKMHLGGAGDFERLYCAVDEDAATLGFYTSASKSRGSISSSIDIKLITEISPYYDKKGGLTTRFNVSIGDKVLKFKADSVEERDRWVQSLTEWRDHFLLHHGDSSNV